MALLLLRPAIEANCSDLRERNIDYYVILAAVSKLFYLNHLVSILFRIGSGIWHA